MSVILLYFYLLIFLSIWLGLFLDYIQQTIEKCQFHKLSLFLRPFCDYVPVLMAQNHQIFNKSHADFCPRTWVHIPQLWMHLTTVLLYSQLLQQQRMLRFVHRSAGISTNNLPLASYPFSRAKFFTFIKILSLQLIDMFTNTPMTDRCDVVCTYSARPCFRRRSYASRDHLTEYRQQECSCLPRP